MATQAEVVANVRDLLDEAVAARWTDVQLRKWINEGMRDCARETLAIKNPSVQVTTIASTSEYALPQTVLSVEHAHYYPGDGRKIPLVGRAYENMDAIWGQNQDLGASEPAVYATYGYNPTIRLKVYPAPATSSKTINLMCAVIPTELATDGTASATTVPFPDAWIDAIADFVEYRALRRDRDQRWNEAWGIYTAKRATLLQHELDVATRDIIHEPGVGYLPRWLVDFD